MGDHDVLQDTVNLLEDDVKEREGQLAQKDVLIATLHEKGSNAEIFADEIDLLKGTIDTLEDEKDLLQKQMDTANMAQAGSGNENLLSQIDFLNSIIADSQDKLAQKDAEIKELEKLIVN